MNLIYVGSVANTHGLKGEIRIISQFKFKDSAFRVSNKLYIRGDELTITSYRKHKEYDMVTFDGFNSIEDVLIYKGESVYVDKDTLEYNGYLKEDLIGLNVYNKDILMGKVVDVLSTSVQEILVIENGKKHMVPNVSEFVKKIDLDNNSIYIEYIKGLVNED